jgi:glycolate oxidase iron-sulfur subunit
MQTQFTPAQLTNPAVRDAATAIRKCVHCGFCTATCPTYVELGNELDSPRGRIMLMKSMLEAQRPATERDVLHIDRCLSCLSCMSTCPSGVNYSHLVDTSRAWIEKTYRRPWLDRALRRVLAWLLPRPSWFRLSLRAAALGRPFASVMPPRLRAMLELAPKAIPPASNVDVPQSFAPQRPAVRRVALLSGCAQQVIAPHINEATVRLLSRLGCEVIIAAGAGCCGALTLHMGKEEAAQAAARANVDAWWRVHEQKPLDAIVINASGCGTTVKDYGRLLRDDAAYADRAAKLASLTLDVSAIVAEESRRHLSRCLFAAAWAACAGSTQGTAARGRLHGH